MQGNLPNLGRSLDVALGDLCGRHLAKLVQTLVHDVREDALLRKESLAGTVVLHSALLDGGGGNRFCNAGGSIYRSHHSVLSLAEKAYRELPLAWVLDKRVCWGKLRPVHGEPPREEGVTRVDLFVASPSARAALYPQSTHSPLLHRPGLSVVCVTLAYAALYATAIIRTSVRLVKTNSSSQTRPKVPSHPGPHVTARVAYRGVFVRAGTMRHATTDPRRPP